MQTAYTFRHDNWTTEKEAHAHNKGLPKAGVTSFYDSFVLNQTLVFQMNSSAEMPLTIRALLFQGQTVHQRNQ